MKTRKSLYLIDGNAYCYRAYYAMGGLSTSGGRPTGAVYGFLVLLNKLRNERQPDYLAVCFDAKGPTLRHEKFAAYKQHRKPMPDDLREQFLTVKELLGMYGIAQFELSGYEADDLIATLTRRFAAQLDVYIVSGDKDMLQLVGDHVNVYNPQKNDASIDAAAVRAAYRVGPEQIADYLALVGDGSDNIPGVAGIGAKSAVELLAEFGSLETLLSQVDRIPQKKRRELVAASADLARMSKELATLVDDVPLAVTLEDLRIGSPECGRLRELFTALEFRSLAAELSMPDKGEAPRPAADAAVCADAQAVRRMCADVAAGDWCGLQLSGAGTPALAITAGSGVEYAPASADGFSPDCLAEFIGPLLRNRPLLKIGYDLKAALLFLRRELHIEAEGPFFDLMLAGYLLLPEQPALSRASVQEWCRQQSPDYSVPLLLHCRHVLERQLRESGAWDLFEKIEMPLMPILAGMEYRGMAIDQDYLRNVGTELDEKVAAVSHAIFELAGGAFNLNSPRQLSEVLFGRLQLPVVKRGKTGPSTDMEVLTRLAAAHPLPALLLEYRELAKLKTTYVEGLLALVSAKTGRIHTTFNQAVTATGRLSSSAPNLQNIPVRTETGRKIRAAFRARDAQAVLLSADYSQIELRVLAHLSADDALTEAFIRGEDIHAYTAALIFGVEQAAVSRQMRDSAKRVNFGIIYGMGAFGLARDLGIPVEQAQRFIDNYFLRYAGVKRYLAACVAQARDRGYVTTLMQRRRAIPEINASSPAVRAFAERVAMNTPIQGTAADIIKAAMVEVSRQLPRCGGAALLLQVHDELVFEVPRAELPAAAALVRAVMEQVVSLRVPIVVNIKSGENWRDMQ
ncbi:MAG: DNA polymerase I [Candidatus Omnitrophica bacterium]|nr:DNA polymerase I [Candidatus Omnitrophota bacterium]